MMSFPPDPHPAPALAPSTPEREISLSSVDRDVAQADRASTDVARELASLSLVEASSSTSSSSNSPLVTLVSADGHMLRVPRRVAEESGTIRQLLLSREEADSSDITIPLPAIRHRELSSILEFCERQLTGKDELERLREREEQEERQERKSRSSRSSKADDGGGETAAAMKPTAASGPSSSAANLALKLRAALAADAAAWAVSSGGSRGLLGRTLASNFLDVPAALAACVDAVASGIRGRTPAEIRARFGIANDLSRQEEEEIKADCAWAFDCC